MSNNFLRQFPERLFLFSIISASGARLSKTLEVIKVYFRHSFPAIFLLSSCQKAVPLSASWPLGLHTDSNRAFCPTSSLPHLNCSIPLTHIHWGVIYPCHREGPDTGGWGGQRLIGQLWRPIVPCVPLGSTDLCEII